MGKGLISQMILKTFCHVPIKCHLLILCTSSYYALAHTLGCILHCVKQTIWSNSAFGHTHNFIKHWIWSNSEFGHTLRLVKHYICKYYAYSAIGHNLNLMTLYIGSYCHTLHLVPLCVHWQGHSFHPITLYAPNSHKMIMHPFESFLTNRHIE